MADLNERWLTLGRPWAEGMMAGDADAPKGRGEWGRVLFADECGVYVSNDFAEWGDPQLDDVFPNWNDHATVGALWGLAAAVPSPGPDSDVAKNWNEAIHVAQSGPTKPAVVTWLLGVLEAGKAEEGA